MATTPAATTDSAAAATTNASTTPAASASAAAASAVSASVSAASPAATDVERAKAAPASHSGRKPLISGTSLSELLASGGHLSQAAEAAADEKQPAAEEAEVDPDSERKLLAARESILRLIGEKRPRFVAAFEQMAVRGNRIEVHVASPDLRDEILRSKTELLLQLREVAGVKGRIDLEAVVDEQVRAARPIKLEDRVRYINEKNPLVAELRKALDLELE